MKERLIKTLHSEEIFSPSFNSEIGFSLIDLGIGYLYYKKFKSNSQK
jgi:hypothetical protein